jgi:hypothetical protein
VFSFNCIQVGQVRLLAYDVSIPCPVDDKGGEVFGWAVLATILYPAGVPLFIYLVMRHYGVPAIARRRMDNAVLTEMLHKYQHLCSDTVVARIATYVGGAGEGVLERRAWQMFDGARGGQADVESISFDMLLRFLGDIGIHGGHKDELQDLMTSFDDVSMPTRVSSCCRAAAPCC